MTPELKEKWIDDLRTAAHTRDKLVKLTPDGFGFCCLGRLAVLLGGKVEPVRDALGAVNIVRDGEVMCDTRYYGTINSAVREEAGLTEQHQIELTLANDRSLRGFEPVIAWIEENL